MRILSFVWIYPQSAVYRIIFNLFRTLIEEKVLKYLSVWNVRPFFYASVSVPSVYSIVNFFSFFFFIFPVAVSTHFSWFLVVLGKTIHLTIFIWWRSGAWSIMNELKDNSNTIRRLCFIYFIFSFVTLLTFNVTNKTRKRFNG